MPCEACKRPIEPDDASAVRAFVQVDLTGSGKYRETIDSRPVSFHQCCFPPTIRATDEQTSFKGVRRSALAWAPDR